MLLDTKAFRLSLKYCKQPLSGMASLTHCASITVFLHYSFYTWNSQYIGYKLHSTPHDEAEYWALAG